MDNKTIEDEIYDFIDEYFSDELAIIDEELGFIENNRLLTPCIDYTYMYNFLSDILTKFKIIDPNFSSITIDKLNNDIKNMEKNYNLFLQKSSNLQSVFKSTFVKRSLTLQNYTKSILDLQTTQEKSEEQFHILKQKKQNLVKIREVYFPIFKDIFLENISVIRSDFKTCLNTKLYYFDKLLWGAAADSNVIVRHMKIRKMEGKFSAKEYLKFIMSLMRPYTDEYKYLEKCLKVYR